MLLGLFFSKKFEFYDNTAVVFKMRRVGTIILTVIDTKRMFADHKVPEVIRRTVPIPILHACKSDISTIG